MPKIKNLISIAVSTGILSLATSSLANDNTLIFTLHNNTKDSIGITGYTDAMKPGPTNPISPITLPVIFPDKATIAAGDTQVFIFNCPSKGQVDGTLHFSDLKTNKAGSILLLDPWMAFTGPYSFSAKGDNTKLDYTVTQRQPNSPDDLYLVAVNADLT